LILKRANSALPRVNRRVDRRTTSPKLSLFIARRTFLRSARVFRCASWSTHIHQPTSGDATPQRLENLAQLATLTGARPRNRSNCGINQSGGVAHATACVTIGVHHAAHTGPQRCRFRARGALRSGTSIGDSTFSACPCISS
jgi:hypothetical protein